MEQWYPLILFLLIQCATPGPHNLTCLYLGGRHGLRGTWGFIGASLGMVFLKALLCGALNMILARFLPEAVKWIKWLGCAYILYLAVNMALSGWREEGTAAAGAAEPGSLRGSPEGEGAWIYHRGKRAVEKIRRPGGERGFGRPKI